MSATKLGVSLVSDDKDAALPAGVIHDFTTHFAYLLLVLLCVLVNPAMHPEQGWVRTVLLPEAEYARKAEQGRFLVDHAMPFLDQAKKFLAGVPGILILADGSGTILRITGEQAVQIALAIPLGLALGTAGAKALIASWADPEMLATTLISKARIVVLDFIFIVSLGVSL